MSHTVSNLQGTKKQIYSQKMKKFRQKFFESFQSDRRKKNKSIAKYFLSILQKNMLFPKNVSKNAFRFPEEYSNLFEPFFFAGKPLPKE